MILRCRLAARSRSRQRGAAMASALAGKTAAETISVMLAVFARVEPALRKSITFDNDTAFAQHALLRTSGPRGVQLFGHPVVEPRAARRTRYLCRRGLRAGFCVGAEVVEQGGAPRGDGEADLVERKRERHLHGLVVVIVLALMDNGDHQIVGVDLELIERLERRRRMRVAHELDESLQKAQPPRAATPAEVAGDAGDR